jgi:hypothetical protein
LCFFSFSRLRFFRSWLDDEDESEEEDEDARPMAEAHAAGEIRPGSHADAPARAAADRRYGRLAILDPGTRGAI